MNLAMVIAVYASISKELGLPLRFPGKPGAYDTLIEMTDAGLLAKATVWAATDERCANQAFNINNGDLFRWNDMWPKIARFFDLEVAPPLPMSLEIVMADKEPLWDDDGAPARAGADPLPGRVVLGVRRFRLLLGLRFLRRRLQGPAVRLPRICRQRSDVPRHFRRSAPPQDHSLNPSFPQQRTTAMPLALYALTAGAFGIGVTEFVIMGLLIEVGDDLGVTIAAAGMLISGYALGVVVGAPLMTTLTARWPRKSVLLALMLIFTLGNLACALAPGYWTLMAARILTAFAHGTFFGVGSVVATSLVPADRKASAIAIMFTGLTVANILGVPFGTWLGQAYGWRATFWAVTLIGVAAFAVIALLVPREAAGGGEDGDWRSDLAALTRRPSAARPADDGVQLDRGVRCFHLHRADADRDRGLP